MQDMHDFVQAILNYQSMMVCKIILQAALSIKVNCLRQSAPTDGRQCRRRATASLPFQHMLLPIVHISPPGSYFMEGSSKASGLYGDGQALIYDAEAQPVKLDCFCYGALDILSIGPLQCILAASLRMLR